MLRLSFTSSCPRRLFAVYNLRGATAAVAPISTMANEFPLPKRHSRHGPPPTCTSRAQLKELTQELLESKPGSLFTYNHKPSFDVVDDSAYAWNAADTAVQQIEYVVRGHAAQIPDTICWNEQKRKNESAAAPSESPESCIKAIKSLVNRLDQEGQMYMKLRDEVRRTRHFETMGSSDKGEAPSEGNEQAVESNEGAKEAPVSYLEDFAAPGPTVVMYDALLDSMAIATSPKTPKAVGTVLETVMDRYYQDGGSGRDGGIINSNVYTVPTILTFNAVLRAIANTPYDGNDEKTRDDAVYYTFATYDGMREVVHRNSATYTYMLETVAKYFPTSRTKGNIAHTLWMQARQERVVNQEIIQALQRANEPSNGKEFDEWMDKYMKEEGEIITEVPLKFRRNEKNRRFNKRYVTY